MKFVNSHRRSLQITLQNILFSFRSTSKKNFNKSVQNHKIDYKDSILLNNVSISVFSGHLFKVQGLNGSGKSTLFKVILNLLKLNGGSVQCRLHSSTQRGLHAIELGTETHYIDTSKNIYSEGIQIFMDTIYKLIFQTSIRNFSMEFLYTKLQLLSLHNKFFGYKNHMSLGQSNRYQILNLVASDKMIWILDEPTIGLDSNWQHIFESIIKLHLKNGGIVFMATHQTNSLVEEYFLRIGE